MLGFPTGFRSQTRTANIAAPNPQPLATTLAPSNTIGPKPAVIGMWSFPRSTYQQPDTEPPTPRAGWKAILPDQQIVPTQQRTIPLFSPAPESDPNYSSF